MEKFINLVAAIDLRGHRQGEIMEDSEIIIEAIKEYLSDKESVDLAYQGHIFKQGKSRDVIMVEGKCKLFGRYKTWIEIDKYKQLARDYKLRNLI